MEVSCPPQVQTTISPRKRLLHRLKVGLVDPIIGEEAARRDMIIAVSGNRTQTIQSVRRRYTDRAITAHDEGP
jgi:hypothetical protein